jgi:hypothetical protein
MAKSKAKANEALFDDEEFLIPDNMIEKCDLAHKYWMKFFRPAEPHKTEGEKKAVMDRYNQIVDSINKERPGMMIKLTMSTQWIPTKMYEGDDGMEQPEPTVRAPKTHTEGYVPEVSTTKATPSKKKSVLSPGTLKPEEGFNQQPDKPVKAAGGKCIIEQILDLHKAGKSNKEIIAAGFNKSTVARQVSEYKKREGIK